MSTEPSGPRIVDRATWNDARAVLLQQEKALTRMKDAISVFLRREDRVFHTWSTHARGEEPFMLVFDLLDLTPLGRQEVWESSPPGSPQEPTYSWMRLSDSYGLEPRRSCHERHGR